MHENEQENEQAVNWETLREALDAVKHDNEQKILPLTLVYWRYSNLIGFYHCHDDEYPEGILFANKDYSDPQFILELIYQHKEFLNDAVFVCLLNQDAIGRWNNKNLVNSIDVFL